MSRRSVVVTGTGIVSSLGEGPAPHLAALDGHVPPRVDAERFAPWLVHPAVALDWDRQIPKKSDQRQMEPWQRLGVYAAGLALDAAGMREDGALKGRTHLIVAAGGGERDYAVDGQILTGLRDAADPGAFLNERLMSDLRPTLFLAQLSNLLAGNIAIVHGVTGASRTFMGEEAAGTDALRIAEARIAAGQADVILVGASYNAERPDSLVLFELGGHLWKRSFAPVAERSPAGGGLVLGSGAAFLVLEAAEHAFARGAEPLARLHPVMSGRTRRGPGDVQASLRRLWSEAGIGRDSAIVSGATGVADVTGAELAAIGEFAPGAKPVFLGDLVGHVLEAVAPLGAALAVAAVREGRADEMAVTILGHRRGEGVVRVGAPR